ncbi:MAG TPA: extracellular solute-binding protein [Thermomicrobiales bacterium]|nr:extracellular solute-binding protein [Thermomicrobiales bacterium]
MADFGMRRRSFGQATLSRRRLLQASAGAGIAVGFGPNGRPSPASAQEITFSRDYDGTTLNLLMEDLLETTIIEEMLPEFTELTGIAVNFEKVAYPVMREKLVPQLAAGPGNGSYDVLEVDFYWVYEFARSGWVEDLGPRIDASDGQVDLERYIPALLNIGSTVDEKTYYLPMFPYPMGLIYREDLLTDEAFQAAYLEQTGNELTLPDSVESYVAMAEAVSALDQDIYGAAMQAQQVDPIVMEFCNFLYGLGGAYYNAEMTAPAINDETGVKAAELYARCVNNAAQPGAAGADLNDTMATYSQGRAFSMISYMFMLSVFNDDDASTVKGVNTMTVMPGGHGLTGSWSWGIPVSSPNPDAGWEFIKWVESPEIAMRRALAGAVPAQEAPYENEEFLTEYPWMPQAKEMIASGEGLPAVTKQAQLVEIMGRHLSDVVSGATSAQEGMDAAAEELQTLL